MSIVSLVIAPHISEGVAHGAADSHEAKGVMIETEMTAANTLTAGVYILNAESGSIRWVGQKVGGEHFGDIQIQNGSVEVADGVIQNGELIVDMNSITVVDIEDAEKNQDLVGHLKAADFFDVATYPEARIHISSGSKQDDGNQVLVGEFTIKDVTEVMKFDAIVVPTATGFEIESALSIDRTKYGITYKSKSLDALLDKFIYDEFVIKFKLNAFKG